MPADFVDALVAQNVQAKTPILRLFGGPFVTFGQRRAEVPEGSKRLLVFVALHRGRVERRYAAGTLWPVANDIRAAGNLRSALWRLKGAGIDLLAADKYGLAMRDDVAIDVEVVNAWGARLMAGSPTPEDLQVIPWGMDALDLLPGWYDDWALIEQERVRQRLLHALEALSRKLVCVYRYAEAVEVAMMAVGADPLRESAQRALIEAHLAEGNRVEAQRTFGLYRDLLHRELGTDPDAELAAIVRSPGRPASNGQPVLHTLFRRDAASASALAP
jgi:DNA-binding SARP family transcriptional activator